MTLYRDILSKAIILAWKRKFLWVLAFFAALAGNGGEYELVFSGSDSINGQSYLLGLLRAFYTNGTLKTITENVQQFFGTYPIPSIFLALLLLLLFLLVVWLIIVSQAALVWVLARLRANATASFHEAFTAGTRFFSPIFLLNVIAKAVILGIIFLIALPLGIAYIRTGAPLYNSLYILAVFLALVPVAVVLSFIVKYASVFAVIREQTWRRAFASGWQLFTKNWLVSLEVAFILFALNLISSLLLIFVLFLLGLVTNPVGTILFFAILTVFGAFVATFQYGAWVNLFFELEAGRARSKLMRWADRLTGKSVAPAPSAKLMKVDGRGN